MVFDPGSAIRVSRHPIKESDRDKTAFITRRGCFRKKVLPFGLTTAPSVFQRVMDLVLCGFTYVTCLVYLDDIIVYSRDFDSHVQRLQEVFERPRGASLSFMSTSAACFNGRWLSSSRNRDARGQDGCCS